MRRISLNQTLDRAYSVADSDLVELKSAMIGLCTDIERYFKVAFDVNLNEEIDDDAFRRILYVFPKFGPLTIEQFNRLVILFVNIRGVNAHLYLSKPIYLDDDLKYFIISNTHPSYILEDDNKITIYGAVLILMLMAQKYMVWPFCTSFFRCEFFMEIGKSEEMSNFQIAQQKKFNGFCGLGKPLTQNAKPVQGIESTYINDVLKRCLTLVFLDLEKVLKNYKGCSLKTASLSGMLKGNSLFDETLISKIVKLRNCWFHGSFIGDIVEQNEGNFEFTLEFAVDVLKELAEVANKDVNQFGLIINDIHYFAQNFFNYYALKLVEVSYKILDNRLLTEDKLDSRLDNIDFSFKRFEKVDSKVFEMFADLINFHQIRWNVSASKFLDKLPRKFDCENLKIAKIHSDKGFKIGDFKTDRKDIVLALVYVKEGYKNLVNNIDLQSVANTVEKECSKLMTIVNINL